ncbi:Chemotaxis signal transduction protein [Collimonas arenae]|uniref:Chemotaxis protein CheW n=1 Tax=Collimonas arenae TaxID=279058 RepID=A0A0A1F9L5_9BURK|nr:chemotaxis protein CheW [Collimonas arenae]AIY41433.1 Chemotaxis signal transduction protein [Collimonas arenae]
MSNAVNHSADLPESAGAHMIDDCWNRIGVRGDGSCERLAQYIDCRNCPVHARAAAELLDRLQVEEIADGWSEPEQPQQEQSAGLSSVLLFRIGEEWLALPTALLEEITELRSIHAIPHRKNAVVLGITNIRGALVTCISLAAMLGITGDSKSMARQELLRRMLIIRRNGQTTAFTADEVHGTLRIAASAQQPVPTTLARATGHFTYAVIQWNGHSVGLLDPELLFHTLDRSLA